MRSLPKRCLLLASCVALLSLGMAHADNHPGDLCRRHIIVAVDGSGSFLNKNNADISMNRERVKTFVMHLLHNKTDDHMGTQVRSELESDIPFYDPQRDRLSVYSFAMQRPILLGIHDKIWQNKSRGVDGYPDFIADISNGFIHLTDTFAVGTSRSFEQSINNVFNRDYDPQGITLSQLFYPIVMEKLPRETAAEEYVLVFASDFKSGGYGSSVEDWRIVNNDMMGNKGEQHDAFYNTLHSYFEALGNRFFRIDYFQYAPSTQATMPACFGYKVKPMVGKGSPENVAISIESDLGAHESSPGTFRFKPLNIKFTHNEQLKVDGIAVEVVYAPGGTRLYSQLLAQADDDGTLRMVDGGTEVEADKTNNYYRLPSFKLPLSGLDNDSLLQVRFRFISRIQADGTPAVPYVYLTQRELPVADISFIHQKLRTTMSIIILIAAVAALLATLILRGRRKKLSVSVGKFAQKYVNVSDKEGAVELPCWFYKQGEFSRSIRVSGTVSKANKLSLGGQKRLLARLQDARPNGFRYSINRQHASDYVEVELDGSQFAFNIDVEMDPQTVNPAVLSTCGVRLDFLIKSNFLGLLGHEDVVEDVPPVDFFFLHDLGNAWVGFDPGTTGSCVAYGCTGGALDNPNITLVRETQHTSRPEVIPSRLAFDKDIAQVPVEQLEPGKHYSYGTTVSQNLVAFIRQGTPNFQSIKKLLGYRNAESDRIEVKRGNTTLRMSGLQMAHLLVKGLKRELDQNVAKLNEGDRTRYAGPQGKARRAVVAIPNNYTLPKITDMVNSVRMLDTFEEVRYIYEAEGILFDYFRKRYKTQRPGTENIMVYDMGGATINISIFRVEYVEQGGTIYYNVHTLGRIGYGVGGDHIDVALMEHLFTLNEVDRKPSETDRHAYQLRHKTELLSRIFANVKMGAINALKLEEMAQQKKIKKDSDFFNQYGRYYGAFLNNVRFRSEVESLLGEYAKLKADAFTSEASVNTLVDSVLSSEHLRKLVYDNVADAVKEIAQYPAVQGIRLDTLIFAGRSTLFPRIRETVVGTLGKRLGKFRVDNSFDDKEIKTGVAYGACWYGIYNSLVTLDNSRLSSAYGFKLTSHGTSKMQVLLNQNDSFDDNGLVSGDMAMENTFAGDGNVVDFYQVMGSGRGDNLFAPDNRHKVNLIGSLDVVTLTRSVGMQVDRRNVVTCHVEFNTGDTSRINDLNVTGRDITKENDWAYVFAASTEQQAPPAPQRQPERTRPTVQAKPVQNIPPEQKPVQRPVQAKPVPRPGNATSGQKGNAGFKRL